MLVTLVGEASTGDNDDEQRHHGKDCVQRREDQQIPEGGGGCIEGGVQQDRQQQAATRVIEDPGEDDRHRRRTNEELRHGHADPNSACSGPIKTWNEEHGQVPERPQYPKQKGAPQCTKALLQAGQREASPAGFLKERATKKERHDEGHRVDQHKVANYCHASWQDQDTQQEQGRDPDQDQQVPRQADSPEHIAAQHPDKATPLFVKRRTPNSLFVE